jgi:hypothetical protein
MILGIGVDFEDTSPAARADRMAPPWAGRLFAYREQARSARGLA